MVDDAFNDIRAPRSFHWNFVRNVQILCLPSYKMYFLKRVKNMRCSLVHIKCCKVELISTFTNDFECIENNVELILENSPLLLHIVFFQGAAIFQDILPLNKNVV